MRKQNAQIAAIFGILLIGAPTLSRAEFAAPSQVTPQNLRPESASRDQGIALSGALPLAPPPGAENLNVLVGDVQVEGAFAELAEATEAATQEVRGKQVTVAQIYALARTLEQIYAQSGYLLARVIVPPQKLVNRGKLVLVVIDGFVEDVDVAGVPERVRAVVAARVRDLVGRRHLRRDDIERKLLIAGDVAGLRLRSTLMRGARVGGTRLVLEGEHRLVTESLGADDLLPRSLGTWQLRGAVAVNSALGLGEQIYGTADLGADLKGAIDGSSPLAVYGAGAVIPLDTDGLTLNPEYAHSTTRTSAAPGVPASLGTFERFALRLRDPVVWTRSASLNLNASVEYMTQVISAPDFRVDLNADRYTVARVGPDYATSLPWGAGLQMGASLSRGLGGRTAADAIASGVPLSRIGAGPDFTKISGNIRVSQPIFAGLRFDLIGFGQLSMGKPMMLSEQFALDGAEAVSGFATGTFNVDQGATVRGEIVHPFAARLYSLNATVSPYVFGSFGRGELFNATSVEQSVINAGAFGLGARGSFEAAADSPRLSFGVELARGFTNVPGVSQDWRGNVNATEAF